MAKAHMQNTVLPWVRVEACWHPPLSGATCSLSKSFDHVLKHGMQSTSLPEVERQLAEQEQQHLIESIRENDAEEGHLQSCIAANESEKARGQQQIQAAMATQADPHFKQMLNQCQIQALQLQEMEFHMVWLLRKEVGFMNL
jgi:hypothetical protein